MRTTAGMIDVHSSDGNVSIQEALGYNVTCKAEFLIKIPGDDRIYEPLYQFIPAELTNGLLVGHLVNMSGEPNLLILRIVDQRYTCYRTVSGTAWTEKRMLTSVAAIPILHRGDNRRIQDLKVPEFHLMVDDIQCIFDEA